MFFRSRKDRRLVLSRAIRDHVALGECKFTASPRHCVRIGGESEENAA